MKAIVEFPPIISHINQFRCKRVRALPDVAERYANDPRWMHQNQLQRMSCLSILSKLAGMECQVIMAWKTDKAIMYGLILDEKVEAPDQMGVKMFHDKCQFPADYFEVLDSGYMEAR
jgi:hypothetical protein